MSKHLETVHSDNESDVSDGMDNCEFDHYYENYSLIENLSREFFAQVSGI